MYLPRMLSFCYRIQQLSVSNRSLADLDWGGGDPPSPLGDGLTPSLAHSW